MDTGSGKKRKESAINEPKKAMRAFDFFVNAKRSEAVAQIGDENKTEELNQLLKSMWNELGSKERIKYEKMEQEDQQRFDGEIATANAAANPNQHRSKSSSLSSPSSPFSSSSSPSPSPSPSQLQSKCKGQQR